jgi:superfamily I DNA/RNA helicase
LAEAVHRVRTGQVIRKPGFDGEFGVIKVFSEGERSRFAGQLNLFGLKPQKLRRRSTSVSTVYKTKKKKDAEKKKVKEKKLNQEQRQAVDSDAHHIIVKAGPGTGKTHTLVQRVIRLVLLKNCPCTVITFTNKAADELQQRIHSVLGSTAPVDVFTLHGYCLAWLRYDNPEIRVVGPDMRRWLIRSILGSTLAATTELEQEISLLLQRFQGRSDDYPPLIKRYFNELKLENLIDIDAVIPWAVKLLNTPGSLSKRMRQKTGALFVDEFQDLNRSQYELIRLLAETSSVFAIGDPDQAIYGFRGSSSAWFARFIETLNPEQHVLFKNYRSSPNIVDAAYEVIQNNVHSLLPVRTLSALRKQGHIFLHKASSPKAEAGFVVRQVESLIGGTSHREIDRLKTGQGDEITLSDIAILYRTGRQAKILADVLLQHGFPVQVVDILPFYRGGPTFLLYLWIVITARQSEISDIIAILKLEKGMGKKELNRYEQVFPVGLSNPLDSLPEIKINCTKVQCSQLEELYAFTQELRSIAAQGIDAVLGRIVSRNEINTADPEVIRFFHLAENFGTSVEQFANHLLRYGDSIVYDERAEAVTLMTLHASKGLEFPVVFLLGLDEGLVPLSARRSLTREEEVLHIEEERRLFYVGMTRAENTLYLSHVEKRQVKGEVMVQELSRFINEIPGRLLSKPSENSKEQKQFKRKARQLSLF